MEEVLQMKFSTETISTVAIGDAENALGRYLPSCRTIAIADANVHRLHRATLERYEHIIIGQGETAKTLATLETIYNSLLEMNADRSTFILGIGGGVVTDLTGFAASTYMRGLHFGFVPTTLLGQVDAAIGGKNGINLGGYKNLVGTFSQPDFVICDPSLTKTLTDRDFRAGLAEMIKAAIIGDSRLFEMFERYSFEELRSLDSPLREAITASLQVKAGIVEADAHESGQRRVLNLGHTFGHAIEKCSRRYIHGEAVAIGTVMIVDIAEREGVLSQADARRIRDVFVKYGFVLEADVETKRLMEAVVHDKKISDGRLNLVLPTSIGHCEIRPTPVSLLKIK
ncbi:MAG: 3-dehydroquinate synthase [Tidjanibacter sp.]|nr:3-dehydroquinate synthase [Tidjanibacter sp.]